MKQLRIGTRGSALALCQAQAVAAEISRYGGPSCELIVIKTTGDRLAETPLKKLDGKQFFVKEIEDALLQNTIDLAVHSAKDLPAILPEGLVLASVLPREDPRDALVVSKCIKHDPFEDAKKLAVSLGLSPRVGTSSIRRIAQLTQLFLTPRFEAIRGNLDTRLRKLDANEYDVLVLATAGIRRLRFPHRISAALPVSLCVPAPGQGAIAVESRIDAVQALAAAESTNDAASMAAVRAERALVVALEGGCQLPIGAMAELDGNDLLLQAVVASPDGSQILRQANRGPIAEPEVLGEKVAQQLLSNGADEILKILRQP